jgi:hypothetical protein
MDASEKFVCTSCQGSGRCYRCGGAGHVLHRTPAPISVLSGTVRGESNAGMRRSCSMCLGSGTCQTCSGTGKAHVKQQESSQ